MEENTLSSNLERIKNAMYDIRQTTNMPNSVIEEVAQAVSDLKLKGRITCVNSQYDVEHIANPQNGDICIVNRGPEEIQWNNALISSNILIFPDEIILPETSIALNDASIDIITSNDAPVTNHGRISYGGGEFITIELNYDTVELNVEYEKDEYDHYCLNSIDYKLDDVSQVIQDNIVKLPFCVMIEESDSYGEIDYNVIKQTIHTYKLVPYDCFTLETNYCLTVKPLEFTLSSPVENVSSGSLYFNDGSDVGTWDLTPNKFNLDLSIGLLEFVSNDGQYYYMESGSQTIPYSLLYMPCYWTDSAAVWGDDSSEFPTGLLSEIFSYIPNFTFEIYEYNGEGWQPRWSTN